MVVMLPGTFLRSCGASSRMAVASSVTAGSTSYSTSIRPTASQACASVSATTPEEIEQAKRSFRVLTGKVSDRETDYAVPHSSIAYLMDRDGSYLEHFLDSMPAERLARRLRELIDRQ
jgi:cytochrome oxidase Cu insertion factor (SCO1/SenC/PrrC family)